MTETVTTLIAPDNHWALLTILFGSTFLAIWLEQKFKWAAKVTGAIITLVIAVVLVNLRVIPTEAPPVFRATDETTALRAAVFSAPVCFSTAGFCDTML